MGGKGEIGRLLPVARHEKYDDAQNKPGAGETDGRLSNRCRRLPCLFKPPNRTGQAKRAKNTVCACND